RGPEQRTQLRAKEIGLIEAHADGAPAEKWIRFRGEAADRQLVATDVEGANHHGLSPERFDDAFVGAILLVLIGHRRAAEHEELGSHETNALGPTRGGEISLLWHIDVGAERDVHSVGGDRLERGESPE